MIHAQRFRKGALILLRTYKFDTDRAGAINENLQSGGFIFDACLYSREGRRDFFLMISQKSYRNAYKVQSFSIFKDFKLNLKHTPALGLYWL